MYTILNCIFQPVDELETTFNFTRFKQYLEGIAGGNSSTDTVTAIVRDLQTFH